MDADHLAVGRGFQLVEARQRRLGRIDRDQQRDEGEQRQRCRRLITVQKATRFQQEKSAPFGRADHGWRVLSMPSEEWRLSPIRPAHKDQALQALLASAGVRCRPRERKSRLAEFMQ